MNKTRTNIKKSEPDYTSEGVLHNAATIARGNDLIDDKNKIGNLLKRLNRLDHPKASEFNSAIVKQKCKNGEKVILELWCSHVDIPSWNSPYELVYLSEVSS